MNFSRAVRKIGLKKFKSSVFWWIGIKLVAPAQARTVPSKSNLDGLKALEAAWQAASPADALTFLLAKINSIGVR
jgi:hypothetical protein